MSLKILHIGERLQFDPEFVAGQLSLMNETTISMLSLKSSDESMEHFFANDPIVLLIIEDGIPGVAEFVETLRFDEVYSYLPILLVVDKNDPDARKVFYNLGIDNFLEYTSDQDELTMGCHVAIRYKVRIDSVMERLRKVSEENITKSIQLDILRRYLPQTVWNQIESMASRQSYRIPEKEQELAVMFADLQSFSTISESLKPKQVVNLLNEVFTPAIEVIHRRQGDIDKFIGDAILAVFPKPGQALASALEIQIKMAQFNRERLARGEREVHFRIGLHYGKMVRGSVGGAERSDNTLIGDAVNTAQRLESQAPAGDLVVSEALIKEIPKAPSWLQGFECFELKGKQELVCACRLGQVLATQNKTMEDLLKVIGKK